MEKSFLIVWILLVLPFHGWAQEPETSYVKGKVMEVTVGASSDVAGAKRKPQTAIIRMESGPDTGREISIESGIINDRADMKLHEGETVVLQSIIHPDGVQQYVLREKYRLPSLLILTGIFFAMGILFAGITGFTSLLGLTASIAILIFFVVPQIIKGNSPLAVSLLGSVAIAGTSLYLAHGFNRRTTVALVSTGITLVLSVIMAILFVWFAKLFGTGSEESVFLQMGTLQNINAQGLLLGGIIIGALGVLDDVTTAQTASIDEISKANPSMKFAELYRAGSSIGREHIASLINTLALAYAGASLPLLLLFYLNTEMPVWVVLNSEFMAEEIVRTLVGSSTLLLAVPISTWIAASYFEGGKRGSEGRSHMHHH